MKKIIFLDIDGVLANKSSWGAGKKHWHEDFAYAWNEKCVELFNEIIEKTDAEIVFSSSWRTGYNHLNGRIKPLFDHNGVNRVPFDVTPQKWSSTRSDEISMWLKANGGNDNFKFIILDDDFIPNFPENFVQCDTEIGITEEIKNKAIELLNK